MSGAQDEKTGQPDGYYEEDPNMYPPHHGMSPGRYLATRISSLKPPMAKAPNPIKLILMLNRRHWAFFFVAFWAWVCDPILQVYLW